MKPWLLEVNSSPALAIEGAIDQQIKPDLIRDIIGLLHFQPYNEFLVTPLLIKQFRKNSYKKRIRFNLALESQIKANLEKI